MLVKCGDFFLRGFVKDQVYRTPVRDLADLQQFHTTIPHNTWVEVEYRLNIFVPLMEAMLRFVEHRIKESQLSLFLEICSIYRFVLVQDL